MKLIQSTALIFIVTLTLISCGGTTHLLGAGNFSKSEKYKINSYYGCCGCEAKYFNLYNGKRKVEQIIYSYNCYAKGNPTKYVFNYNAKGNLIDCNKYVATKSNDFTMELTQYEIKLFSLLDSDTSLNSSNSSTKYSDFKGFRKPIEKEVTHSFPLIKKGFKLVVH